MNRLHFGIGDFVASFKGDTPGHPFRGNQFDSGKGKTLTPPEPKISSGYELHDKFTTKKGNAVYAIQKPADGSERGWMITKHMRVTNPAYASQGKPSHYQEMRDTKENVLKEFESIRRYEG